MLRSIVVRKVIAKPAFYRFCNMNTVLRSNYIEQVIQTHGSLKMRSRPRPIFEKKFLRHVFGAITIFTLIGCDGNNSAVYNAYFYFPEGNKEYYLGIAQGLNQCGAMAHSYANSNNLDSSSGWGYICCLKTKDSECAEKHR
jgi:hypothetical protein